MVDREDGCDSVGILMSSAGSAGVIMILLSFFGLNVSCLPQAYVFELFVPSW